MQKENSAHFTPLMGISIILTISILAARFSYAYLDTTHWLIASVLSWGIAFILYKRKVNVFKNFQRQVTLQCLATYTCILMSGGLITSHQIDNSQKSIQAVDAKELSSLDKTIIKAQAYRSAISQRMQSLNIKDQDYAVIAAMALGDKTALNKDTKDIYSISGASHILAVSGLHIGIIFQLFILLLGGKRRSFLTISLSMIAIWAYVIFIGMPASAVRSATMISICSFALLAHKEAISLNNLCFAYVIMLFATPLYLFDISFQMSFLAVGSILLFSPFYKNRPGQNRIYRWAKGMFLMSLAAQIGTLPLIAYYFGRISCYSLFTGFIAIPAATFILYLSAVTLFLVPFTFIPYITIITTPILHFVASCLVSITQACNTALKLVTLLPGASIEGIKMNIPQLCLIYLGIIVGYILLKKVSGLQRKRIFSL